MTPATPTRQTTAMRPGYVYPFSGGPFDGQSLVVDMIETTRGPVAPEEVRLEVVETSLGKVAKFTADGAEVYRFDGEGYVWESGHG